MFAFGASIQTNSDRLIINLYDAFLIFQEFGAVAVIIGAITF